MLAEAGPWKQCGATCRTVRATPVGTSRSLLIDVCDPLWHEAVGFTSGRRSGQAEGMATVLFLAARGAPREAGPRVVETGGLVVDRRAMAVTVDGQAVLLGPGAWVLLDALAACPGEVVGSLALVVALWPDGIGRHGGKPLAGRDPYHPLRALVCRLRARLGSAGHLIETRDSLGYVLRDEPTTKDGD